MHALVDLQYHHHSTGSCNYDSDSDTDADNDKKDNTNRRKKLRYLLNLLLIRRQYLRQRQPKFTPPRLVWTDYVSQLIQQNEFSVTFRMSLLAFNKLVEILRDDLEVHYHQALRSSKKRSDSTGIGCCHVLAMVGRGAMARY